MSIGGRTDDVDVVLDDGLGVELGDGRLQGVRPGGVGAELLLEDLAGGLARPEAGDTDLLGDLRPGLGDRGLELRLVLGERDDDLDLVALFGLNRALHQTGEVSAGPRQPMNRPHGRPCRPG